MRPTGTVTFLFTDIEGSTRLWELYPERMQLAFARQEQILRQGIEAFGGYPYKMIGDAFQAAFSTTIAALQAAIEIQYALNAQTWGETPIRVRMAIHVGVTEERGDDYVGPVLNRVARLLAAGHGGQILLTQAAASLAADQLPDEIQLKDLDVHYLKDLTRPEHIYHALAPNLPLDFPPLKTIDSLPNNLPHQATSFIGREKEISELHRLFSKKETRLVTLTGPGGTGKTRLSLQIAADLLDQFPDGCWFVELAAVMDPDLVPKMVANVLDIREAPDKPLEASILAYLRSKKMLLILDNCEHLVQACAELAARLLRECQALVILSSSREILGIAGEIVFRVPSLSMPDLHQQPGLADLAQYEAVRLFVERAQAVRTDFALTEENAPWVTQIISRLDGIPLAIELAAARVRLLSPAQISARLDDAFRLLTGGSRAVLPRHQTLRALIDWSYDLLCPQEQALFRRLSVFSGSWSLDGAEQVCSFSVTGSDRSSTVVELVTDDIFNLTSQLVDKSLVFALETNGPEVRYRIMETIRQYAHEKLVEQKESEIARARHLRYYLQLAETSEPFLRAREQIIWLDRLESELDNFRLALEWSLEKEIEAELRLSATLLWFWHIRGRATEGIQWLQEGLSKFPTAAEANDGVTKTVRARALLALGILMSQHKNQHQALPYLEDSYSIYQSLGEQGRSGAAYACLWLARGYQRTRDPERAKSLIPQALAWFRQQNDRFGLAETLSLLADPRSDPEEARQIYQQVLSLQREIGDTDGIAFSLQRLSQLAFGEGEYSQALQWLEESLQCFRAVGNRRYTAGDLHTRASIHWALGDYPQAIRSVDEALAVSRETDDMRQYLMSLLCKGDIALSSGDVLVAENIFYEARQSAQEIQDQTMHGFALIGIGEMDFLAGKMELAQEHWQAAKRLGDEAHFWPLVRAALLWQAKAALWQGNLQLAAKIVREGLNRRGKLNDRANLAAWLEVAANIALQQMDFEKAARLFGAANRYFRLLKNTLTLLERKRLEVNFASLQTEMGADRFQQCFSDGASLTDAQIQQML